MSSKDKIMIRRVLNIAEEKTANNKKVIGMPPLQYPQQASFYKPDRKGTMSAPLTKKKIVVGPNNLASKQVAGSNLYDDDDDD